MSMRLLYLIFMLIPNFFVFGQKKIVASYEIDDFEQFIRNPKTDFSDSISFYTYLKDVRSLAFNKGYILFSIDSVSVTEDNLRIVHGELGEKFSAVQLKIDPDELDYLKKHIKVSEELIIESELSPRSYSNLMRKIEAAYLNNGYPFMKMSLTNVSVEKGIIQGDLNIDKGPVYQWTKIHIRGDSSINEKYISSLLSIKTGELYSEEKLMRIPGIIDQTPFVRQQERSDVLFTREGAELYLYLESVPVSSVNGIVGFQPNPVTGKLTVTGDLKLKLQNVLKRGELLNLQWQSIREQTQSLQMKMNYPYLFRTPFGINAAFDLYKRDTTFLETKTKLGVQYNISPSNMIEVFYHRTVSNIISTGSSTSVYNDLGNVVTNGYGAGYHLTQLDYIPNPRKGLDLSFTGIAGVRLQRISDTLNEVSSSTFRGELEVNYFYPIYKRHVLHLRNLTSTYHADDIFENELFRFGGLQEQRGFNEDELIATTRTTFTLEYRFLLDRNSHVLAFFDATWYENRAFDYYNDVPYGMGVGFSFGTNIGLFNISYALGKQFDNPLLLANSKVHFGYVAIF